MASGGSGYTPGTGAALGNYYPGGGPGSGPSYDKLKADASAAYLAAGGKQADIDAYFARNPSYEQLAKDASQWGMGQGATAGQVGSYFGVPESTVSNWYAGTQPPPAAAPAPAANTAAPPGAPPYDKLRADAIAAYRASGGNQADIDAYLATNPSYEKLAHDAAQWGLSHGSTAAQVANYFGVPEEQVANWYAGTKAGPAPPAPAMGWVPGQQTPGSAYGFTRQMAGPGAAYYEAIARQRPHPRWNDPNDPYDPMRVAERNQGPTPPGTFAANSPNPPTYTGPPPPGTAPPPAPTPTPTTPAQDNIPQMGKYYDQPFGDYPRSSVTQSLRSGEVRKWQIVPIGYTNNGTPTGYEWRSVNVAQPATT